MNLSLDADTRKLIEERVTSGKYATAEEVVAAAMHALSHDEAFGDFGPGEWDTLLAKGEASGTPLDGEAVLSELRQLRDEASGSQR